MRIGQDLELVSEVVGAVHLRTPGVFFTEEECAHCEESGDPDRSWAGLFAAKEAIFKALPPIVLPCFWTDIAIGYRARAPIARFRGALAERAEALGLDATISITHSGDYAAATALVSSAREPDQVTLPPPETSSIRDFSADAPDSLELIVRPNDLDRLGHVNHAVYLEYFETGRQAFMERHGLGRRGQIVPVVTRVDVRYRRQVGLGKVRVESKLDDESTAALKERLCTYRAAFEQQVLYAGGVAAEATVQVAFVEAETGLPRTLEDFIDLEG